MSEPLTVSPYLDLGTRPRPRAFRFYVEIWNRERQHEVETVWALCASDAERAARDALAGTGCEFSRVIPEWDAVLLDDGRQMTRKEWEA